MIISERIIGGIWSSVIGDVLGVPVEFLSRGQISSTPVVGLRSFGTHNQPEGTWSDDSSLLLCSVENIAEDGNLENLMRKFLNWLDNAYWTAGNTTFDVGLATREAINHFRNGEIAELCGSFDEWSNGNGSLMRILPYSYLVSHSTIDERRIAIFKASATTHGHSRSKLACWLFSEIVRNLLLDQSKELAVDSSFKLISDWANVNGANSEWSHFKRCNSKIVMLQLDEIKSTGYVVDSLEAALYCFLRNHSVLSSLLEAVNLGNDTDTIAAVTGALSGTYYGLQDECRQLIPKVSRNLEIQTLIDRFLRKVQSSNI